MGSLLYLLKGRDMSERTDVFHLHEANISDSPSGDRGDNIKKEWGGGGEGGPNIVGRRSAGKDGHGNTGGHRRLP